MAIQNQNKPQDTQKPSANQQKDMGNSKPGMVKEGQKDLNPDQRTSRTERTERNFETDTPKRSDTDLE